MHYQKNHHKNRWKFRLPPGSYGLLFIGKTLQLISAYKSVNPELFMDEHVRRYGSIFMTHVFGETTVFSADPELNLFILQNEGKLLDCSYLGSISNLLGIKVSIESKHRKNLCQSSHFSYISVSSFHMSLLWSYEKP
ncbi:hypothetical protein LR48_Vigan04g200100 [Vigna angularis]|uniref:Uncharacterized protein n=1 Tax=Phaseolus angularis TaxID=3914 RepID=A0A0L9UGC5_PHAAN|nr:hypothetical protein LR48_Vigan04g200100 [Vigna angularis]